MATLITAFRYVEAGPGTRVTGGPMPLPWAYPAGMSAAEITSAEGAALAALAVRVIGARLAGRSYTATCPGGAAAEVGASFVTLERAGRLRGCVGALDAVRPLHLDVARNALRAMADPRLPAVAVEDWAELDVTVSVLGPREPIPVG